MATGVHHIMTLEEVEAARAATRTRGEYEEACKRFFESGELAEDFSLLFPGKEESTLRNSITQNAKKIENHPKFQILMVPNGEKKHVVLLNLDVYHAQKALENEA